MPAADLLLGQAIAITTQVSGTGTISQVALLVNGQQIEVKQSPPYDFLLDSGGYVSGTYTITVLAQNDLGQTGVDSQAVVLQTPPPARDSCGCERYWPGWVWRKDNYCL